MARIHVLFGLSISVSQDKTIYFSEPQKEKAEKKFE